MVNYILPAFLINVISLFVFMMPSESGEKITLGISAMLNMTVFLMAVIGDLPPTDNTSIISKSLYSQNVDIIVFDDMVITFNEHL